MNKQITYDPIKTNRAAHRQALINEGLYGRFKQKAVPDKKKYDRKDKGYLRGLD